LWTGQFFYFLFRFSIHKVGLRQALYLVVSPLFSDIQNILALSCFFRLFHANLLLVAWFVGWVLWRAAVRWTANQSGRKVSLVQLESIM
jgi:hypothetical protein